MVHKPNKDNTTKPPKGTRTVGAPEGNVNAQKWDINTATKLFDDALELSRGDDYDFIGEIARDLKVYRELFNYLSDTYSDLKPVYSQILSNLEANCFSHSKKGKIREATAIVNLKSNYHWTDRIDQKGLVVNYNTEVSKEEAKNISDALENEV